MLGMRNAYTILARKYQGKTTLGRPKHKKEDNIKRVLEN
jgi:hypothetical protein